MEQSGINECQTCMGICRQCHMECVLRLHKGNVVKHYGCFPDKEAYRKYLSYVHELYLLEELFTLSEKEDVFTNASERNHVWKTLEIEDGEFLKMVENERPGCIYLMEMRLVQWNK